MKILEANSKNSFAFIPSLSIFIHSLPLGLSKFPFPYLFLACITLLIHGINTRIKIFFLPESYWLCSSPAFKGPNIEAVVLPDLTELVSDGWAPAWFRNFWKKFFWLLLCPWSSAVIDWSPQYQFINASFLLKTFATWRHLLVIVGSTHFGTFKGLLTKLCKNGNN